MLDAKSVIEKLKLMKEMEVLMAQFYMAYNKSNPENRYFDFIEKTAREELKHAIYIEKMISIIEKYPEKFSPFKDYTSAAINNTLNWIKENIEKIKKGELKDKAFLAISYDLERSLLESKYANIVKTDISEFNDFIKEIVLETEKHKELMKEKLNIV